MEKIKYIAPTIDIIQLDNEISLTLDSTPPQGPGESIPLELTNSNPIKNSNSLA